MDECVNCGSKKLRPVPQTPGDSRTEGLPLSPGARQWRQAMLENVGQYHSVRPNA
jgi:hypothetical protein